jgi:NADPH:quinone reductase-like Zn-dependent oxidoreductase
MKYSEIQSPGITTTTRPDPTRFANMSQLTNTALWMDENCQVSVCREQYLPVLEDGELLIQTLYSGINPADTKHGLHLGIRPVVMGYDFAGSVIKTASNSKFEVGDVVAGSTPTGVGRPSKYGTHQTYLTCPEDMAFKVPDHISPGDAACLGVVVKVAADALCNDWGFQIPRQDEKESIGPVLIWGGSSSVGVACVQFARAAGAKHIIVTASASRHEEIKALGATHCFDYKSPDVTIDIKEAIYALECGPVLYAIDAAGTTDEPSSADQLSRCVTDEAKLSSVVFRPQNPRFKIPFASKGREVRIRLQNGQEVVNAPKPLEEQRMNDVLEWVLGNYGQKNGFVLPNVRVLEGSAEDVLRQLQHVIEKGAGFSKVVIKHPLR